MSGLATETLVAVLGMATIEELTLLLVKDTLVESVLNVGDKVA